MSEWNRDFSRKRTGVTGHFQCRPFAVVVLNKRKSSASQNGGSGRTGMAARGAGEEALLDEVQAHHLLASDCC